MGRKRAFKSGRLNMLAKIREYETLGKAAFYTRYNRETVLELLWDACSLLDDDPARAFARLCKRRDKFQKKVYLPFLETGVVPEGTVPFRRPTKEDHERLNKFYEEAAEKDAEFLWRKERRREARASGAEVLS